MKPAATLSGYAAVLVAVFVAAVGVGRAVGPVGTEPAHSEPAHSEPAAHTAHGGTATPAPEDLDAGGLAVSQDGYTLRLAQTTLRAGTPAVFRFRVLEADGRPLTRYAVSHDKELHLVVVRRDLSRFQHLHPTRAAEGTWSVPLVLAEPGPYKVFADFTPAGGDRALILAADLVVPGDYTPTPLPPERATTTVDGYEVALDGRLVAGTRSRLTLTVAKAGRPVTDLQPYLGAFGHLVALREGDLAYLHVHPDDGGSGSGPSITFHAEVPAAATYRLFLDFRHAGVVRTADLTATAASTGR